MSCNKLKGISQMNLGYLIDVFDIDVVLNLVIFLSVLFICSILYIWRY